MKRTKKILVSNLITYGLVIAAFVVCQMLIGNKMMSRSFKGQLVPICVYVVMAVSLNLTVGISGELSLGHAGFMSIGAFTGTIVSAWLLAAFQMENEVVRLLIALLVGGAFAGIAGVLFALNYTKIEAKQFDFNKSISVLVMVVLGGMGNLRGCIIAAVALKLLELILLDFGDLWMLIYALVLILVMILNSNARFKECKRQLASRVKALLHRKEAAK